MFELVSFCLKLFSKSKRLYVEVWPSFHNTESSDSWQEKLETSVISGNSIFFWLFLASQIKEDLEKMKIKYLVDNQILLIVRDLGNLIKRPPLKQIFNPTVAKFQLGYGVSNLQIQNQLQFSIWSNIFFKVNVLCQKILILVV